MSLEVFGDEGPEGIDTDAMARHGWEFDDDCLLAKKIGDDEWMPIEEAWDAYRDWMDDVEERMAGE